MTSSQDPDQRLYDAKTRVVELVCKQIGGEGYTIDELGAAHELKYASKARVVRISVKTPQQVLRHETWLPTLACAHIIAHGTNSVVVKVIAQEPAAAAVRNPLPEAEAYKCASACAGKG